MGDRDALIVQRYREGATLASVGQEFGIGKERVRQIALRASRDDKRAEMAAAAKAAGGVRAIPVDCAGLSVRAANALRNENFLTIGNVADALVYLNAAPLIIPNFGKSSLIEVRNMLDRFGILEDVPLISKSAAEFIGGVATNKQDIVKYFGRDGQYGPSGTNIYRFNRIDRKILDEVRSIARAFEDSTPK